MSPRPLTPRNSSRGVAVLGTTLLLLLTISLMTLYANKGIWLEQRATLNQTRAKQALEVAEAGVEFALTRINKKIADFFVYTAGEWALVTPTPAISQSVGSGSFNVVIEKVANQIFLLKSTGQADCAGTVCQSEAVVSTKIRINSVVFNKPNAALTTLDGAQVQGSVKVSGGTAGAVAVYSGGQGVSKGGAGGSFICDAGSPKVPAVRTDDYGQTYTCGASDSYFANNESFFKRFFGLNEQSIKKLAVLKDAGDDPTLFDGGSLYWIEGNPSWGGSGTIGTVARPVVVVVKGDLQVTGGLNFNGILYVIPSVSCSPTSIYCSSGAKDFYRWSGGLSTSGAVIIEGAVEVNGSVDTTYNPAVFNNFETVATVTRILGSWKDW